MLLVYCNEVRSCAPFEVVEATWHEPTPTHGSKPKKETTKLSKHASAIATAWQQGDTSSYFYYLLYVTEMADRCTRL